MTRLSGSLLTLPLFHLFCEWEVDIGQFIGQPLLQAAVKSKSLVRFAYKDAGLNYYGNGIVATEETIKNDPATLKAFIRATLKGMQYAFAHPDEAGKIINKYQKQISPEVGEGETRLVKELADVAIKKWAL